VREQADYLYEPPLVGIGLRDWQAFDRAVREGYEHTMQMIEKHGVPLTDVWSEGPAVAIPHREPDNAVELADVVTPAVVESAS